MRSAALFQLVTRPSRVLEMIASSDDWTIAASSLIAGSLPLSRSTSIMLVPKSVCCKLPPLYDRPPPALFTHRHGCSRMQLRWHVGRWGKTGRIFIEPADPDQGAVGAAWDNEAARDQVIADDFHRR